MFTANRVYSQRLATVADARTIVPLWQAFAQQRTQVDPSMQLKPGYDFEQYISYQLQRPFSFFFLLEVELDETSDLKEIVGCFAIYFYDEAPPPELEGIDDFMESPFQPRRVGAVLGLYIDEKHRQPHTIKLLVDGAIAKAEELKVTDVDVLVSAEQTGVQKLLERHGFTKSAVQYSRHYQIADTENLPSLHPDVLSSGVEPEMETVAASIPLRNIENYELVKNPNGEVIFLQPITNAAGELLCSSSGLPIYPNPLHDLETNAYVFDQDGKLVTCPVLQDCDGVVEYAGIPQFCPPLYQRSDKNLVLKQDKNGTYLFAEADVDESGKVKRSPDGKPIFKQ
ncbi:MAG: GNAT family N-acetyltransferase [Cyanothece sp. SIO2G6]|nr:GNAT family N-acetyltransferase [Cyanothece sp. SIO2G6]